MRRSSRGLRRSAIIGIVAVLALAFVLFRHLGDETLPSTALRPDAEERRPVEGPALRSADPRPEIPAGRPALDSSSSVHVENVVRRVRGVVRVKESGAIARSATVELTWSFEGKEAKVDADEDDGRFELLVPDGALLLRARVAPDRHGANADSPRNYVDSTIELGSRVVDGDLTIDLEADPGTVLRGRVVDAATGSPLADAAVSVLGAFGARHQPTASTNARGEFVLTGVRGADASDELVPVEARRFGYRPRLGTTRAIGAHAEAVTITLDRGVSLRGRVTPPPRQGLHVLVTAPAPGDAGWGEAIEILGETRTQSDGAFALDGMPPAARADILVGWGGETWQPDSATVGALHDLDLSRDRLDVVVPLEMHTVAELELEFPGPKEGPADLIYLDASGRWSGHAMGSDGGRSWLVPVPVGGSVDVLTFARPLYRGALRVSAPPRSWADRFGSKRPPDARLALSTAASGSRVSVREEVLVDVTFVDALSGRSIVGRKYGTRLVGGRGWSPVEPTDGQEQFRLGLGDSLWTVHVAGYRPRTLRLRYLEPTHEEIRLRLEPLEGIR